MKLVKYIADKAKDIKAKWCHRFYVALDGRCNSVTLSKALYNHIMSKERHNTDVFVFRIPDNGTYAFCMREDWLYLHNALTIFCPLQYNEKYHKIGFRTDRPSVTAICDDYGIPIDRMVRLTCIPRTSKGGNFYYEIQRPHY